MAELIMVYPEEERFYTGFIQECVRQDGSRTYMVVIHAIPATAWFASYEEAFAYLREQNIMHNLAIRNCLIDRGEYYEMQLTRGKTCLFDKADLELVREHIWFYHTVGYTARNVGGTTQYLHNYLLQHTPGELTVDHINRDRMDNRRANLRLATKTEQLLNRCIPKSNKSGYKGVAKIRNMWTAFWTENGVKHMKSYSVNRYGEEEAKALAIAKRSEHGSLN